MALEATADREWFGADDGLGRETPPPMIRSQSGRFAPENERRIGLKEFSEFCESMLSDRLSPAEIKALFVSVADGTLQPFAKLHMRSEDKKSEDFVVPASFDYSLPTTDFANYGYGDCSPENFYGPFAEFRRKMDYLYHKVNFTRERQQWQDAFVQGFVKSSKPQKEPWLVMNCGADNAATMEWLTKNCISLENLVYISKSDFKLRLPEWANYVMHEGHSRAKECTHDEAKYLQELLQEYALSCGQNIFVECKLRDSQFFIDLFSDIRRRFPKYKIAIFYVLMSEIETSQQDAFRVHQRLTEASLGKLMEHVDFCAHVQWQPRLLAFATIDRTGRWQLIADRFAKVDKEGRVFCGPGLSNDKLEQIFKSVAVPSKGGVARLGFPQFHEVCTVKLGFPFNETELRRIFDAIDEGRKGTLDLGSFVRGVQRHAFLRNVVSAYNKGIEVDGNYDFTKTTCDVYANPNTKDFCGPYASIRAERDYSYHVNFTRARQAWQDSLIDGIVSRSEPQTNPWVVYTCGPMGAGKGYALSWMSKQGYFPLENLVHIDPDYFKSVMPEWEGYIKADDVTAGSKCHKESCYIQEIAQEVALRRNQNMWVDGSLRDAQWFVKVFDDIRKRFSHYKIAIFHVYASEKIVRERIAKRGLETGRVVPEVLIVESLAAPDHSLSLLTPKVDFLARINNESREPILASFEFIDRTGGWDNVIKQFDKQFETKKPKAAGANLTLEQQFRVCSEVKDRTYLLKKYRSCFVGKATVDALVSQGFANTRAEAVEKGNRLLEAGLFFHVTKSHKFKDDALFYRFADSPAWHDDRKRHSHTNSINNALSCIELK